MYRLFEKDIFMNQKPTKSPTGFEDNLRCCSELYRRSGKDVSVLSVKIAQMVSKAATWKVNIAV